jgi:hypothetical protein
MNQFCKIVLAAAVAVGCLAASGTASAHWHGSVGVYIGPGPYWWGAPYYPYSYYYPPAVVPAPAYMAPSPGVRLPAPQSYWYFCRESNTYYPYVSDCPGGWERVAQQPAAPPSAPSPDQH